MQEPRIEYLFDRYFKKTATAEERQELTNLISNENHKDQFIQLLTAAWEGYEGDGDILSNESADGMLKQILAAKTEVPVRRLLWPRIAAAAAVLILIAGASWFFLKGSNKPAPVMVQQPANDASPGTFKARLTLADGRQITLDSAALGELVKQGNTSVINKDGSLQYKPAAGNQPVIYNTIATNRGETYSFSLADGSRIWLNSASTVRFPVAFDGKERRIQITGEVYIQVAKDRAHPFIVSANGMEVLALGTEFNVNAYTDESNISATLVEGSVEVKKEVGSRRSEVGKSDIRPPTSVFLTPGQQTQLTSDGQLTAPADVNMDEVVSWKEGFFHFESADLKTILRQFARWYDVEVVYESPVKNRKFFAIVKRSSTLKNVLELLQDNNIVYKIEGKKLIVSQ